MVDKPQGEEAAKEDVKEQVVEAQEANNQEAPEAVTAHKEEVKDSKEINFARLRESNEQLKQQVSEMQEMLQKQTPKESSPKEEPDELDTMADDDIITKAQAMKLAEKMARQAVDRALTEEEKRKLPERTKSKHSDYETVVTKENIKKLEQQYPVLAEACAGHSNPWEAAYNAISTLFPSNKEAKESGAKISQNASKPLSSNAAGRQGPLANAQDYQEMSKASLYKEMMEAARRA